MVHGTRPNISESHSEIRTRVPFCIALAGRVLELFNLSSAAGARPARSVAACRAHKGRGLPHRSGARVLVRLCKQCCETALRPVQPKTLSTQKGTRVLISLWDSLMFGRVPGGYSFVTTFRSLSQAAGSPPLCIAARPALPRSWVVFKSPSHIRTTFSACSNHQRRFTLWRPTEAPTATSCAYF